MVVMLVVVFDGSEFGNLKSNGGDVGCCVF